MAAEHPHKNTAFRIWEGLQVELQGRYSIQQFFEVLVHAKSSSKLATALTILAAPLPALLLILFADALPLQPSRLGLWHQTLGFFFRLFVVCGPATLIVTYQIRESAPILSVSRFQQLILVTIPTFMTAFTLGGLAALWVFPVPFSLSLISPSGLLTAIGCLWWMWKDALSKDTDAKRRVSRFMKVLSVQNTLVGAYIAYYALFTIVGEEYQEYVSVLLPIMKLIFKNMVKSGLYYLEDLAPAMVVANIDVFHGAFVCRTMEQTQGQAAISFIMVVDVLQLAVSYFEVCAIVRRINMRARDSQEADKYTSSRTARGDVRRASSRLVSALKMDLGIVDYAVYLLETYPRIRDHPIVVLPRHVREEVNAAATSADENDTANPPNKVIIASTRVSPMEATSRDRVNVQPRSVPRLFFSWPSLSTAETSQLECVDSTLKMMHMIEFYVLVEFAEVAVAAVFTLYLLAVRFMPNRIYYAQLNGLEDNELQNMVKQLAIYTALELVSFIVLCLLLDRQLQHFSTVRQLAFVLQKHWNIIIPTMAFWVFMIVQLTLEHFGIDFTLQFNWVVKNTSGA